MQRTLYLSGIASLYGSLSRGDGSAAILMYHSVVDESLEGFVDPDNSVKVEQFRKQMAYLKKRCNVISLEALLHAIENKTPLPKRTVVLTFDDGYRDNLTHAAPILKEYDLPATIFVCTGYIERQESQWIDDVYSIFSFRTRHQLNLSGETFDLTTKDGMDSGYNLAKKLLMDSDYAGRSALFEALGEQLEPDIPNRPRLTLNWDEVRRLRSLYPLIEVGLHTRDHTNLTGLDKANAEAELLQCQKDFEASTGSRARFLSYPYGLHNMDVQRVSKNCGLKAALAVYPVDLVTHHSNPWALPRVTAMPSLIDLKVWMSGAFPALSIKLFGRAYG